MNSDSMRGYLLHLFHREGKSFTIFGIGRLENDQTFGLVDTRFAPTFYVRASEIDAFRKAISNVESHIEPSPKTTMDREQVMAVSATRLGSLRDAARKASDLDLRTYEADLSPSRQYAIHRSLKGAVEISGTWRRGEHVDRIYDDPDLSPTHWTPSLRVLALDIETTREADLVLAVSLVSFGAGPAVEELFLVGSSAASDPAHVICCDREAVLLSALAERIAILDPDILTGWNLIDFDLLVLQRRFRAHRIPFNLGRTRDSAWHRDGRSFGDSRMVVPGRQVIDAMRVVRAMPQTFDDYRLDTVARELLDRGKTLQAENDEEIPEAILRAYEEDRSAFCEYCLEDARLVRDILLSNGLLDLTLQRSLLTGLPLDGAWGNIAAFDFLYTSELHRRGMTAPTLGVDQTSRAGAPGGMVIAPRAGLYRHVFVFDFKSLYPSIIRTFNIDPLAHLSAREADDVITAPNGAAFNRETAILPTLLDTFFASRERAREAGDGLAAFTYKILMNSFYGVLGTNSCRFASPSLAGAITEFGHQILRWTKELIEAEGARVLYGDTDSVFVDASLAPEVDELTARARGTELCDQVNSTLTSQIEKRFGLASKLELEFEKYYTRFFLPTMRGSRDRGRAKGYAGLKTSHGSETLEIVGMEAVRRDWTNMSHDLQRTLLDLVFHDSEVGEIQTTLKDWVERVRSGDMDADLVYRKGLRKSVESYTRTSPPHVKAARLLPNPRGVIRYVITQKGPQPVGHVDSPLDYEHYVEKQIRPIAESIAQVCGIDVNRAIESEPTLFDDFGVE